MSLIISIDGNIGAGKTTIIGELKKKYNNTRVYQHFYCEMSIGIISCISTMILFYLYSVPAEIITAIYFVLFFTTNKNIFVFLLKFHYKIIFVDEPVDEWENIVDNNDINILQHYYNNSKKFAFTFQILSIITRVKVLKEIIKNNPNAIIVSERSVFSDKHIFTKMLRDTGDIDVIHYKIYKLFFRNYTNELPQHIFCYLRSNPYFAYTNVQKRGRIGEMEISLTYLEKCHEYHELLFNRIIPELIINVDNNFILPEKIRNLHLQQIGNKIIYSIF